MTALFDEQRQAVIAAFARSLGADDSAFAGEQLVFATPPPGSWFQANIATFGIGTVVSVVPALRSFAEEHAPAKQHFAINPEFLELLRDECRRLGLPGRMSSAGIRWALNSLPPPPNLPPGFKMEVEDRAWMNEAMASREFHNALGVPDDGLLRDQRNLYAVAVRDAGGEIAAVAGAFDSRGLHEVGVDVARAHRGLGLGTIVVAALVRETLERGGVPLYGCRPSNIRSQRTAWASGFLPVGADASIS